MFSTDRFLILAKVSLNKIEFDILDSPEAIENIEILTFAVTEKVR